MKNSVSKRFSLSCKFKQETVELTILDKDSGTVQVEIIPIKVVNADIEQQDVSTGESTLASETKDGEVESNGD